VPQDIDFHIPFPARRSTDGDRAVADHLDWPRALSMITTEEAARRHARGNYADLATYFYPAATGPDLDLGVDLMSWFFLYDDLFDGLTGKDPVEAARLVGAVTAVFDAPLDAAAPLISRGLADLWRRTCEGMSADFQVRAARHWRDYLNGYVDEAEGRAVAGAQDSDTYFAIRRRTIGVLPTVDMAERTSHCEVPKRMYESAPMAAMLRIAIEVNVLFNDIASLEKEIAVGDPNNMVLILMRENGWTSERSIAHMQSEVRTRIEEFLLLETVLPGVYDSLGLDADERDRTDRFRVDGLRTVIRGSHDWHRSSGRYDAEFARSVGRQAYLEDLGIPSGNSAAQAARKVAHG
jgi:pentalenene synthase